MENENVENAVVEEFPTLNEVVADSALNQFDAIFANATILDETFLKNSAGYTLPELEDAEKKTLFQNYYFNMITAVQELNVHKPSRDQIESFLEFGSGFGSSSRTASAAERKYLFLMATAKQLYYDKKSGRAGLFRGENIKELIAEDTYTLLRMIGLTNNGTNFKGK